MSERDPEPDTPESPQRPVHTARLELIWDVLVFQLRLLADGVRDLILSPMSVVAGVLGLIMGGDDPHRYLRQVLRFGRRTELWINLFGHGRRSGTSNEFVDPLRERVFTHLSSNARLSRAGTSLNRKLDSLNASKEGKDEEPRP